MDFILTGVVVTWGHTFLKTHQAVLLTWVHFILCNLHLHVLKGHQKQNTVSARNDREGPGRGQGEPGGCPCSRWLETPDHWLCAPWGPAPAQNLSQRMAP